MIAGRYKCAGSPGSACHTSNECSGGPAALGGTCVQAVNPAYPGSCAHECLLNDETTCVFDCVDIGWGNGRGLCVDGCATHGECPGNQRCEPVLGTPNGGCAFGCPLDDTYTYPLVAPEVTDTGCGGASDPDETPVGPEACGTGSGGTTCAADSDCLAGTCTGGVCEEVTAITGFLPELFVQPIPRPSYFVSVEEEILFAIWVGNRSGGELAWLETVASLRAQPDAVQAMLDLYRTLDLKGQSPDFDNSEAQALRGGVAFVLGALGQDSAVPALLEIATDPLPDPASIEVEEWEAELTIREFALWGLGALSDGGNVDARGALTLVAASAIEVSHAARVILTPAENRSGYPRESPFENE